jgi:hypothetical protein
MTVGSHGDLVFGWKVRLEGGGGAVNLEQKPFLPGPKQNYTLAQKCNGFLTVL